MKTTNLTIEEKITKAEKLAKHIEKCSFFTAHVYSICKCGEYTIENMELIHTIEAPLFVSDMDYNGRVKEIIIEQNGPDVFFMKVIPGKGYKIINCIMDVKKYTQSELFTIITLDVYRILTSKSEF